MGHFHVLLAATMAMAVIVVAMNRLVWQRLRRLAETHFKLETCEPRSRTVVKPASSVLRAYTLALRATSVGGFWRLSSVSCL